MVSQLVSPSWRRGLEEVYMQQIAKEDMFSESCNVASRQWSRGVSIGTLHIFLRYVTT